MLLGTLIPAATSASSATYSTPGPRPANLEPHMRQTRYYGASHSRRAPRVLARLYVAFRAHGINTTPASKVASPQCTHIRANTIFDIPAQGNSRALARAARDALQPTAPTAPSHRSRQCKRVHRRTDSTDGHIHSLQEIQAQDFLQIDPAAGSSHLWSLARTQWLRLTLDSRIESTARRWAIRDRAGSRCVTISINGMQTHEAHLPS